MSVEKNPLAYTKSSKFLLDYSWKGKDREQIIQEMALPEYEQKYLDEAIKVLSSKNKFTGMDLDRYILSKLDDDEDDVGEIDDDDIVYIRD